jgi:hypothetical protein
VGTDVMADDQQLSKARYKAALHQLMNAIADFESTGKFGLLQLRINFEAGIVKKGQAEVQIKQTH